MKKGLTILILLMLILLVIPFGTKKINEKKGVVKINSETELAKLYYQKWTEGKRNEWLRDARGLVLFLPFTVDWAGDLIEPVHYGIGGGDRWSNTTSSGISGSSSGGLISDAVITESAVSPTTQSSSKGFDFDFDFDLGSKQAKESASDYSKTNSQVEGIQEGDFVKTNGKLLFHLTKQDDEILHNTLRISAFTPNGQEPAKLVLEEDFARELNAKEMYLSEKHLTIVFANDAKQGTEVFVYEIIDDKKLELRTNLFMEGTSLQTRMTDDHFYILNQRYLPMDSYHPLKWGNITPEIKDYVNNETIKSKMKEAYYNPKNGLSNLLAFYQIPLNGELSEIEDILFFSDVETFYMNKDHFYIAYGDVIKDESKTRILQFDAKQMKFKNKGMVEGRLLNQFSMDEHDSVLRIATTRTGEYIDHETKTKSWGKDNRLFLLDKELNELSQLNGIARGEDIKSVRFDGDKGYFVTFRQTDPLFVFDLSNPNNPRMEGELKIPGYSSYLHPYKEGFLLGVGYDGTEGGTNGNMKISLFDVRKGTSPKEISHYQISQTNSDVLENHRAFFVYGDYFGFYADRSFYIFTVKNEQIAVEYKMETFAANSSFGRILAIEEYAFMANNAGLYYYDLTDGINGTLYGKEPYPYIISESEMQEERGDSGWN